MKNLLIITAAMMLLAACKGSDEPTPDGPTMARRTVVVYMAAENDISDYAQLDIDEMEEGAKLLANDSRLLIFVDRASNTELPFIARVTGNTAQPLDTLYKYPTDFYSSASDRFYEVLHRAQSLAPAGEYGLVLWGHALGWTISDSVAVKAPARRAYGRDTGDNSKSSQTGKWLNLPSMRTALTQLGTQWKFIFCDCCNMMGAEVAYELRNNTDYLIASPAEIPGVGAPYDDMVPALFSSSATFYQHIADIYARQSVSFEGVEYKEPITVVKSANMQALASATRNALLAIGTGLTDYPNMDGIIYYYNENSYSYNAAYNLFYDLRDFMRHYAPADVYATWEQAYREAVVYKTMEERWLTNKPWNTHYTHFSITDDNYGGISMFVPQSPARGNYAKHNETIRQMQWYYAAGLQEVGW